MTKINIVRAWKDEEYYLSLTEEQRASLPANPAAALELSDTDLRGVSGGSGSTNTDCSHPRIGCGSVPVRACQ
jgi:mersacidin/lichenicidin family type 2 lantibiotic